MVAAVSTTTVKRIPASMAGTELRTEKYLVTPQVATRWLKQNTESNRKPSIRTIEAYAREMQAGRWQLTHQGIAFNQSGELVDGQHRLHAVVAADVSVEMMVTTGLALEYNSPLDQGYNRSFAHVLGKNTRWVSVVRALSMLETGVSSASFKNTVGMLEDVASRHTAAIDAMLAICSNARACPTGVVATLAYTWPIDRDRVSSFAREVNTGELLQSGDPAYSLRNWVAQGRHKVRETILATAGAVRASLQKKKLARIVAGISGTTHDGYSNYVWIVSRRRGLKIFDGTPSPEIVSFERSDESAPSSP